MKKSIIFILLLCQLDAFAQQSKKISTIRELVDSIAAVMKRKQIPGLMLGITTRDSVLFSGGIGYADVQNRRAVNNHTLFRMGSITKSLVSLAMLKLVGEGKLDLNDEVRRIAPEVPFLNKWENTNPVRIINLLEHTTGFDDFKLNNMYSVSRAYVSTKEIMLRQKNSMICRWKPSERYSYCNVNYAIAGYIISKITGVEYDRYLTEQILKPAGMVHSNFNLFSQYPELDVREYTGSNGNLVPVPSVSFLIGPAGSLWSDSEDMVSLLKLFLNNGKGVISPEAMEQMETSHSSLSVRAGLKNGYGLGNEFFGKFRGHGGLLGTCRSSYRYSRELGVGFVVSSNGNGLADIEDLIAAFLTRNIVVPQKEKFQLNKEAVAPYLGYYQVENPRFDLLGFAERLLLLKVEIINDTLNLNLLGNKRKIVPTGTMMFANKGADYSNIVFLTNGAKKVLVFNDRYCERVPAVWAITRRLILILGVLFSVSSIFPFVIGCVSFSLKKINVLKLIVLCLPFCAVLFLIVALFNFQKVLSDSYLLYKLENVTGISLTIYCGTLLFGLLSFFNLFFLPKNLMLFERKAVAGYMLFVVVSLFIVAVVLFLNGWIGLCTWDM